MDLTNIIFSWSFPNFNEVIDTNKQTEHTSKAGQHHHTISKISIRYRLR